MNDNLDDAAASGLGADHGDQPAAPADTLTILQAVDGHLATKTVMAAADGQIGVRSFSAGARFRLETLIVRDVRSLSDALVGLAADPTKFVIRGALAPGRSPGKDGTLFRRKAVAGSWQGYFQPVARRWACIDIDDVALPKGMSQAVDPEGVVRHVLGLLGEPWSTASVHWQASTKAALPGVSKIKLHLWYWLDRPVSDRQLRAVLANINARHDGGRVADEALCDSIQIHYTAAPVFAGLDDPLPRRHGLLIGSVDAVAVDQFPVAEATPSDGKSSVGKPTKAAKPPAVPSKTGAGASATITTVASAVAVPTVTAADVLAIAPESANRLPARSRRFLAVLDDILALARARYGGGGVGDGERDAFLFAAAVAAANVDPSRLADVVGHLAGLLVPGKPPSWIAEKLSALEGRILQHELGERTAGQQSLIYSPSNRWFITHLSITRAEMAGLVTLVSAAERKKRLRDRTPRNEWLAGQREEAEWQTVVAAELYLRRSMTAADAARAMGISERQFRALLAKAMANAVGEPAEKVD